MLKPNATRSSARVFSRASAPMRLASCCTAALLMTASVPIAPQAAWADEATVGEPSADAPRASQPASEATGAGETAKDESIYIRANARGGVEGIYAINLFETPAASSISDPASYESVKNLTTNDELEQQGGVVRLQTAGNEPFYYEGILARDTELPWNVDISYTLDGRAIEPDDLAGQSGEVSVTLSIKPRPSAEGATSPLSDFTSSFFLQAQGTFPDDAFSIEDAGDAMVAHSGSNTLATVLVLPDEESTVTLRGQASDFNYGGWQISALPLNMAVDVRSQNTESLEEAAADINDATTQLSDGSTRLDDGLGTAAEGATQLAGAASTAHDGAGALAAGAGELKAGADELAAGSTKLDKGALDLKAGASALSAGVAEAGKGIDALSAGAGQVSAGASDLSAGADELAAGWGALHEGIEAAVGGIDQLEAGSRQYQDALRAQAGEQAGAAAGQEAAQQAVNNAIMSAVQGAIRDDGTFDQGKFDTSGIEAALAQFGGACGAAGAAQALDGALDGYGELAGGISALSAKTGELSAGADQLSGGVSALQKGAGQLASGASAVAGGASEAADGVDALKAGTGKLALGASDLKTGTGELKTGAGKLKAGTGELADGSRELAGGMGELAGGAGDLKAGIDELHDGSSQLASGALEMKDATADIDEEILDELQKAIDEKFASQAPLHSFVAPENTDVRNVQFVYVVDGIDEPEDEAPEPEPESNESIFDRIAALFTF